MNDRLTALFGDLTLAALWAASLLAFVWLADRIRPHLPRLGRALRDHFDVIYHVLAVAASLWLFYAVDARTLWVVLVLVVGQFLIVALTDARDQLIADLEANRDLLRAITAGMPPRPRWRWDRSSARPTAPAEHDVHMWVDGHLWLSAPELEHDLTTTAPTEKDHDR